MVVVGKDQVLQHMLHIGSLKKESSPKTRKYRADVVNGLVVLDPEMLAQKLETAKQKVKKAIAEKKDILVVCDKSMYADELKKLSQESGFHYLNAKVPPGFLTNFDTLMKRIHALNKDRLFMDSEDFMRLTKKEQVAYRRNVAKIEKVYGGVTGLKKKPDLVVVFDASMLTNFLHEVKKKKIDNVVFCSSDFMQRWSEDSVVVANMKSYKSVDFIFRYLFA